MSKRKSMDELFDGRHFDREVIILCVRRYLRFKLSLRDPVERFCRSKVELISLTDANRSKNDERNAAACFHAVALSD